MLDGMELHWIWLIAAAVLAGAEILLPGVFLIFLAGAAALTAIAAALGLPFAVQLGLFPLFSLGAMWFGKEYYVRNPIASSDPLLNERLARHLSETVVVVGAIENGAGRVKLGDSVWTAKGPDAEIGAKVRIIGAENTCLLVEPVVETPLLG